MKKIICLLAISLTFISCEKSDETENKVEENKTLLKTLFGSSIVDYDAAIFINTDRTMTPYENDEKTGTLSLGADFNSENVGNIHINDIVLESAKNYNRNYSLEENDLQQTSINSLYGKSVKVMNSNCLGSDYCGIDFSFEMTNRLTLTLEGLKETNKFYKNSNLVFNWNVVGNPDDLMAIMVLSRSVVEQGKEQKHILKTFANRDGKVVISGSELSEFQNNEPLSFILIRGNQYTHTTPSNKVVAVHGMDIVHYEGVYYMK